MNNIIYDDLLPPSRRSNLVESDYTRTITQHSPLSPYARYLPTNWIEYISYEPHLKFKSSHNQYASKIVAIFSNVLTIKYPNDLPNLAMYTYVMLATEQGTGTPRIYC